MLGAKQRPTFTWCEEFITAEEVHSVSLLCFLLEHLAQALA